MVNANWRFRHHFKNYHAKSAALIAILCCYRDKKTQFLPRLSRRNIDREGLQHKAITTWNLSSQLKRSSALPDQSRTVSVSPPVNWPSLPLDSIVPSLHLFGQLDCYLAGRLLCLPTGVAMIWASRRRPSVLACSPRVRRTWTRLSSVRGRQVNLRRAPQECAEAEIGDCAQAPANNTNANAPGESFAFVVAPQSTTLIARKRNTYLTALPAAT